MFEIINEISVWKHMKAAKKPLVLYGTGNGADMIIDVMDSFGIGYCDIFVSDSFFRGQLFKGKKVLSYSQVLEKYSDFIIVMVFGVHDKVTLNDISQMAKDHEFLVPTLPIAGGGLFDEEFLKENDEKFDRAFELLSDEKSRRDYINVLRFKLSGKVEYLLDSFCEKQEIYSDILPLCDEETIADLGAYDGDTIREFLAATNGKYKKIFAFEPDKKNFQKLKKRTENYQNIEYFNVGAWDKKGTILFSQKSARSSRQDKDGVPVSFDSVDNLIEQPLTFIKMDVEGAEKKALEGAKKHIVNEKPKLYICAYHRNEDMFALPLTVNEFSKDYKIFFRQVPYVPAWESNFYCIAE